MFGKGVMKDYYIVFFDWYKSVDKYYVIKYQADRTKTVRQMWNLIYGHEYNVISEGKAINIGQYPDIIKNLDIEKKRCHMLMRFDTI